VVVVGSGFRKGDKIVFGGKGERTRFVNSHTLRARVPISDAMDAVHQSSGGPPIVADIQVMIKRGRALSNSMPIHYASAVFGG
jgi:hypothetical protein